MQRFIKDDFQEMEKRYRARFINSLSGFKSVNLVGTQSKAGVSNLSIVSSVVHLGADPALMGFIMRPVTVTRDTYHNILETGYYTFNHLRQSFFKKAHQTSARYPAEVSEFDAVDLGKTYSAHFPVPYVTESPVRIGLEFKEKIEIKLNGTLLIIGEVQEVWVPSDCIHDDGFLDIEKAGSITCSGLDAYHKTQKIARLSYAKPNRELRVLVENTK